MTTSVPAVARQPRVLLVIGGTLRLPIIEMEVDQNSAFEADSFRVTVPLSLLVSPNDPDWLLGLEEIGCELYIGFPSDPVNYTEKDLEPLLQGRADRVSIQWDQTTLTLTGRDMTGLLIDAQIKATLLNQTVAQVVTAFAAQYGLAANVAQTSATAQKVGSFLGGSWAKLAKHSAWDLLTALSQEMPASDGTPWECYVSLSTLYFGPRQITGQYFPAWGTPANPGTLISLRTERNLIVSKDITVTVKGWNLQTGATTVAQVSSSGHKTRGQGYVYVLPGLTPTEAQAKAAARLAQLTHHEVVATFSQPGDTTLTMQSEIILSGTDTQVFDTTLYPYSISHRFVPEGGYVMEVVAKNHAATTVVA